MARIIHKVVLLVLRSEALFTIFEQGEGTRYLDQAIELDRQMVELCPQSDPKRPILLTWLASHLNSRHEALGAIRDLDEAIVLARGALELCPPGHPGRSMSLIVLAAILSNRYKWFGTIQDLNEAVLLGREALSLRPTGHPDRSISLNNLARDLAIQYKQSGAVQELNEAIVLSTEALSLRPEGHPCRSHALNRLAIHISIRFQDFRAMEDLLEAIVLDREALSLWPEGHPCRADSLNLLAADLSTRYKLIGDVQDLNEAIVLNREALSLRPEGHHHRHFSLNDLAVHLHSRYKQLGVMQDLDESICLNREALSLRPEGHLHRQLSLHHLASVLCSRYEQTGTMQDLDEAIVLDREALNLRPEGHPDRSLSLNSLASDISTRYEVVGDMHDLNEAIILSREALNLRPERHHDRSGSLANLASKLSTRYQQLGALQDLNEALILQREALAILPEGNHNRAFCLCNLAAYLTLRYQQLGDVRDLNEAVIFNREALGLRPQGHPYRADSLNNLAADLSLWYEHFGALMKVQTLDEAIGLTGEVFSLRRGYPNHTNNHEGLLIQYNTFKAMQGINEDVVQDKEEFDPRPKSDPERPDSLVDRVTLSTVDEPIAVLKVLAVTGYKGFKAMDVLDEAISLSREALSLWPAGHPNRSDAMIGLATKLYTRYEWLGRTQNLDEAICLDRDTLDLLPKGHRDRSRCLYMLARDLHTRFMRSKNLQDKEQLFSFFIELADIGQSVSPNDFFAAKRWVRVAEESQHRTLCLAYETALRFLVQHLTNLPSLPEHHPTFKHFASTLAVDAFSAFLRDGAPARAMELLEQGRAVFWNQLTRSRSPLHDVIESGPEGRIIADEFARLALQIGNAASLPGEDRHERLFRLNIQIQDVVVRIRKLPGLSHFLLPPLFSDLRSAASEGPVIILNASVYSCDALIVFIDRDPVHIPLQATQKCVRDLSNELDNLTARAKWEDVTKELACFLRTLWSLIVSPIIDILRTTVPLGSRVWWCPTSSFIKLPLHAAGPFRKGQRNLPDLYISSYTPTLTSLIRARQSSFSTSISRHKGFLAIGQATAVGECELLSVGSELSTIGQRVDGRATFTKLEGEEACIARVVEELARHEWAHLACHGLPNRKQPFASAFALHDGHFTIQRIIGCELQHPEFVYLSACHTTVGDEQSPDEVIHLASAMQFIGFRSVIGTMWGLDDGHTNKVTSTFYAHMTDGSGRLDYTRAALALNRTMNTVDVPFDQRILYIHIGA